MKGEGQGFRKAILINEHFVVHGVGAIAVPIFRPVQAMVTMEAGRGVKIFRIDEKGGTEEESLAPELLSAAQILIHEVGASEEEHSFRIILKGELLGWSGLGSSAAFCVSLARALCNALDQAADDSEINRIAYQGEKVFASNPSGIDNTVATYGKAVWYQRRHTEPFEFIGSACPIWLVVGNSGVPSLTREQVEKVGRFKESYPEKFGRMSTDAAQLGDGARRALKKGDLVQLGTIMNRGQELLSLLGVSHEAIDGMIACCRNLGALGSKLTGAGGGGCILALVEEQQQGEEIVRALERMGKGAFCVRLAL